MFRGMRRRNQLLPEEEILKVIERGTSGVLALLGDEGYPYAIPLGYVYLDSKFYFHGAKTGHKIDAIKKYEKASFCIIDQDNVIPEDYATDFRSVIAFGKIRILENPEEIIETINLLAKKYYPEGTEEHRQKAIAEETNTLCMMELTVEHMTGKEAIKMVKERKLKEQAQEQE